MQKSERWCPQAASLVTALETDLQLYTRSAAAAFRELVELAQKADLVADEIMFDAVKTFSQLEMALSLLRMIRADISAVVTHHQTLRPLERALTVEGNERDNTTKGEEPHA